MQHDDEKYIDFALPAVIKDFIFDLHDATRRSMRQELVQELYELRFKVSTLYYKLTSCWTLKQYIVGIQ
jgi:hypothetical protein